MRKLLIILAFLPLIGWGQGYNVALTYNGGVISFQGGIVVQATYNTSAISLFERMDEQPNTTTKTIYSIAFDSLEYYGLDNKLERFFAPKAHSQQASTLDWFQDTTFTVVDSMHFQKYLGYVRGIDKRGYINTNLKPSDAIKLSLNSAFYGLKIRNKYNYSLTGVQMGVLTGGGSISTQIGLQGQWRNSTIHGLNVASYAVDNFDGMFTIGRNRADTALFFYNDVRNSRIRVSSALPDRNIYLYVVNNNGVVQYFTRNVIETFYASAGLTDFEYLKLFEVVNRFTSSMDSLRTETVWSNEDLEVKLVNNDDVGFGLRLVYQKDEKKIAVFGDSIFMSLDNGLSYPYKIQNSDAENITFGVMYTNNAIFLASKSKNLYVSYDSLSSIIERTLKDTSGSDYVYHTPVNPTYPGEYYKIIDIQRTYIDNGLEMLFFGNYGNVQEANATLVYYSPDTLKTIKVAYKFGIDSSYRDNGSTPSSTEGNYLGDTNNTRVCRHVHSTAFSGIDTSYYVGVGDSWPNTTGQYESGWLKGKYNKETDTWIWDSDFRNFGDATYWKSTGLTVIGDTMFWGSDGSKGIYKAKADQLIYSDSIINIYPEITGLTISIDFSQTGEIMALISDDFKIVHSTDYGNTFNIYSFVGLVPTAHLIYKTFSMLKQKDSDGWFHCSDNNYPATYYPGTSLLFRIK